MFPGSLEHLKDELRDIKLDDLQDLLNRVNLPPEKRQQQDDEQMDDDELTFLPFTQPDEDIHPLNEIEAAETAGKALELVDELPAYPTPRATPPINCLAGTITQSASFTTSSREESEPQFEPWKAAFAAGPLASKLNVGPTRANALRQIRKPRVNAGGDKFLSREEISRRINEKGLKGLHRRELPPEPRSHHHLDTHPMGPWFMEAEKEHLLGHQGTNSWSPVSANDPRSKRQQVLGCMWLYIYKFDKHGRLARCKARLVIRGDQQAKRSSQETYAATLAARSFRTFMAIAARFDLEMVQYDVLNAFVNVELDEEVFMHMPPGYRENGKVLRLNKALFGLRRSPILWQKKLTTALVSLGFTPVPHEPCCLTLEGILVFFYVDDIVFAYRRDREDEARRLIKGLDSQYKLSGGENLQWFLGIEILRDRPNRRLWLSQASYIDKIARRADSFPPCATPMARTPELLPYTGLAEPHEINRFQRKIGSLLYAAVITRPDIAFATSRLARFLTNPGPAHQDAVDRVLGYLKHTRGMALQLGGGDDFVVYSDASFADNSTDRKSSQAYVMKLFGGLIGWRANKQDTVTTSTTEAELLALSQAAKEGLYMGRLFNELSVRLEKTCIQIYCDNAQTVGLVNKDITRLQTRLRHVDIHNHWLRQEAQAKRICIDYVPSGDMLADGLTKPVINTSFDRFIQQLGLIDISDKLQLSRGSEQKEDVSLDQLGWFD